MRPFEILIIITTIVSAVSLVFFKQKKLNFALPAASVLFCILSLIFEGYRIQMLPAYLLALALLLINVIKHVAGVSNIKKIFKVIGIFLLVLSLAVSVAFPALFPIARLQAPDGEYSVGTMNMSFTDKSRTGIFTSSDQYREIAVRIWYPTDDIKNKKVARFFDNKEMSEYLAQSMQMPNLFGQVALVKTHSYIDAGLSDRQNKYPVILFSGGYLGFAGQNTVLMESLASHGYIVFGVSHPYEDFVSEFPGGKLVRFDTRQVNDLQNELVSISKEYPGDTSGADFEKYQVQHAEISNKSIHIWSNDIKFIADQVEELDNGEIKSIFENKLDTSAMGLFGHSFGGATAGQACLEDSRFKGFINMDGAPFGDSVHTIIKQPFMIIKGDAHKNFIEAGYDPRQTNYIDVTINGAKHLDFTDFTVLLPSLKYLGALGSTGGDLQEKILKNYVISFFDKYLKGTNEPLLDEGLHKYSEVTVKLK